MGRTAAVMVGLLVGWGAPAGGSGEAPPPAVGWTALHWEARKMLLSATATVHSEVVPAVNLRPPPPEPPTEPGVPLPPWVVRLTVATDLPIGRDEAVEVLLHPASLAALHTHKRTFGRRPHEKNMRYAAHGYYEWRRAPRNERERAAGPPHWTDRLEQWVRPDAPPAAGPVTDPYALLYVVSAAPPAPAGPPAAAWVLSRGRLVHVTFQDGGTGQRAVDFTERWPGGERRRQGPLPVRLVRVGAAAAPGAAGAKVELGFLGLQGDLTVALEACSGLPVELVGHTRAVGELVVRLTAAELRAAPQGGGGEGACGPSLWHTAGAGRCTREDMHEGGGR